MSSKHNFNVKNTIKNADSDTNVVYIFPEVGFCQPLTTQTIISVDFMYGWTKFSEVRFFFAFISQ